MTVDRPIYFKINGVDFAPFLLMDGVEYEENDIHSEETGRTMDGLMHIGWVGTKGKWSLPCIPIPQRIAETFFSALEPGWKTVDTNIDPHYGHSTKQLYCGGRKAVLSCVDSYGNPCWAGLSFSLTER